MGMDPQEKQRIIDEAITSRRSVRQFLPTPISQQTVADILRVASRAPSGTNTQPWKVYVLTGEPLKTLSEKILAIHNDVFKALAMKPEYDYYPPEFFSPYIERRRKVGYDMYGILGIEKGDKLKMHAQHGENYRFFGAPVGLMFSVDRRLGRGSWVDYGFFMEAIAVAARARGLHTCPQAAFTPFYQVISEHLGFAEHEMLVCGMALGYEDTQATINTLKVDREPVENFTQFYGFEG